MKAVLMSIQPKWCAKIANGEKTIEVRKTRPNLQTPFKVYIYATWNGSKKEILVKQNGQLFCEDFRKASGLQRASGKVVGEFVCDRIDNYIYKGNDNKLYWRFPDTRDIERVKKESCLTIGEIIDYTGDSDNCYFWHITDLKIYDKPKELSEFKRWNRTEENSPCTNTKWLYPDCKDCKACNLTRPPQSYMLVEEK